MSEARRKLPYGLQRRIHSFGSGVMLIIIAVGCLVCATALRSVWNYQQTMTQLTEIQQLKREISKVSELLQNHVVVGEDNLSECIVEWKRMTADIYALDFPDSRTVQLLAEDFKAYQRNTDADFYLLMGKVNSRNLTELYESIVAQQEDREFLCELLLSNLTEHLSIRYPTFMHENSVLMVLSIAVFICLLLLTGLFADSFSKDIYRPVQMLVCQAEEIMDGNYGMEDMPIIRDDELGYLTEAFNEMKKRIRENFRNQEELWRLESLLQDAEFRALQSQVNPHFLFNALGLATEAALTENADRTVDVIEHISYMLHYGLTSVREDAWLADELKMVRSYLFLQQQRFGDRVAFLMSVPQEPMTLRIPGMTLQPLVENAVMHGVEHMTANGRIEVLVTQTPRAVEICVRDNGCGIPPDQVAALNSGEYVRGSSRSTGLGVTNVRNRMMVFYGRSDLMRIESQEGQGTSVYLKYLVREGEPDVSSPDRG